MWINALGFLGGRITNFLTLQKELEGTFLHAYCAGVQSVLKDTYHIEAQDENDELSTEDEPGLPNQIHFDQIVNPPVSDSSTSSEDKTEGCHNKRRIEDLDCSPMLERQLIKLYRSAHEHAKSKLSIQLQSQPYSSRLMNLFAVPFLTREEVERKPALRHSFRNILKKFDAEAMERGRALGATELFSSGMKSLNEMADKQYARNGEEKMQATVIAQVEILCGEIFCVRDVESGAVIQGDANGKVNDVTHLCRFEIVVDIEPLSGKIQLGQWQITDWDDLLDGNVFFQ